MSYQHTGDAWTDVVTADERRIYCDACAEPMRVETRERCQDDEDMRPVSMLGRLFGPDRVLVGYFTPDYDDICDMCGVVAANQHTEDSPPRARCQHGYMVRCPYGCPSTPMPSRLGT